MTVSRPARREPAYDILIIGGGMVGAALAAALRDTPWRIGLVEGAPPPEPTADQVDLRVSAVSPASQRLLADVGAWETLRPFAAPYRRMRIWESGGPGATTFSAEEAGVRELGHIVENGRIQHALWARLRDQANLTLHCPARLASLIPGRDCATVYLEGGARLSARLVVGADGGRSRVRQQAGIATIGWSYGQTTIVGNVTTARPHQATALQRFLPTGPVALLPLYDGRCSLAWHTAHDDAKRLLGLDDEAFLAALTRATGQALGPVETIASRGAFPLRRQHATRYFRGRVVLIGDAAHTIHPLAGQGVNLGFLDAAVLATLLGEGDHGDPADPHLLRRYEARRRAHNRAVMRIMDLFAYGFGTRSAPLRLARNLGLDLADRAGLFKGWVARYAMGLGNLPREQRQG